MAEYSIHLKLYEITDGEAIYSGADQEWYDTDIRRMSGCGPTTASNLIWYLSQTRSAHSGLCAFACNQKSEMQKLMLALWDYVTPGRFGVNDPGIMTRGLVRYGMDHGISLQCALLEIPRKRDARPDWQTFSDFVVRYLEQDLPIAYLNLSNGSIENLDSWHWVTLVGFETDSGTAVILDGGKIERIDLRKWYDTTMLGGALVSFSIAEEG